MREDQGLCNWICLCAVKYIMSHLDENSAFIIASHTSVCSHITHRDIYLHLHGSMTWAGLASFCIGDIIVIPLGTARGSPGQYSGCNPVNDERLAFVSISLRRM